MDIENPKVQIVILVLNQSPITAVFPIVRLPWDPKTALTGDPLYNVPDFFYLIFKIPMFSKLNCFVEIEWMG
jgi:hypothetical protein